MALLGKTKAPEPKLLGDGNTEEIGESHEKVSAEAAGYMELQGAKKTGGCLIVDVDGGISKELGCCNLFRPEAKDTDTFSCGTCFYED